jgi:hypothetical protein
VKVDSDLAKFEVNFVRNLHNHAPALQRCP